LPSYNTKRVNKIINQTTNNKLAYQHRHMSLLNSNVNNIISSNLQQYPHVSPNKRDIDEVKLENFKENVRKSMRFEIDRY